MNHFHRFSRTYLTTQPTECLIIDFHYFYVDLQMLKLTMQDQVSMNFSNANFDQIQFFDA